MSVFRCLKSATTLNYHTGADLGATDEVSFTLPHTPIFVASFTGTISVGGTEVQTFVCDKDGSFTFTDIGNPLVKVTAASLNPGTGVWELTFNQAPGTNSAVVSYTGAPDYALVTSRLFGVSCSKLNQLCNSNSTAYVAAVTICNQRLYA